MTKSTPRIDFCQACSKKAEHGLKHGGARRERLSYTETEELREKLLHFITSKPVSAGELAVTLGVRNREALTHHLRALVNKKLIKRTGHTNTTRYTKA